MKEVLDFLSDLRENNHSVWFQENKERYQGAREKFLMLTRGLIEGVHQFDGSIPLMEPKDCMFRIFRDVRFSKDKTPYKVNFGSFICNGGRNSCRSGYYIHFEPGASFIGGGIYMPPVNVLKAIRQEIYDNPEEFLSIIQDENFKKIYPDLYSEDKLKMAPKGFPKEFEHIDLLKYKSYTCMTPLDERIINSPDLIDHVLESFRIMMPFNAFLNRGIDYWAE
ncbi:MAG: DUF2461 domain-containing protein [Bacteroidota bacterium]|nr:DUF2461 domain-containing protein [Bacteroidota bacterium]MDP4205970.1 DUF2461 domain-containing protein [Bacteroidota bacterium]